MRCVSSGAGGSENLSANWLMIHVDVANLAACKDECITSDKTAAMQYNTDGGWCGCLASDGIEFGDAINDGKHTFKGDCTLCDLSKWRPRGARCWLGHA